MSEHHGRIVVHDALLAGGFVQVPLLVLENPELRPGPKLIYALLLRYAWEGQGYPGHAAAAEKSGLSEVSVYRHLRELQEAGLIVVEREGLGRTNTYHILPFGDASASLDLKAGFLKKTGQTRQKDESDTSERGENDVKTPTQDSNRPSEGRDDNDTGAQQAANDAHGVAVWIAREFAPREPTGAVVSYLERFSAPVLERAADLTRKAAPEKPIAYLYAVAQDLAARGDDLAAAKPAAHGRAPCLDEPEPTEAEREAAHETYLAVKEWLEGDREGPAPWEREE